MNNGVDAAAEARRGSQAAEARRGSHAGPASNTNSLVVSELYRQVASRNYRGLRLYDMGYPYGHVEMDAPSFRDSLGILFGP